MDERIAFESWLLREYMLDDEWDEARNCYKHFACHLAWKAWQTHSRETQQLRDLLERARRLLSVCSFDAPEDLADLDLICQSSHSAGDDAT